MNPQDESPLYPLRVRWRDQFWALVDNESVRPFIWAYYLALFCWGIYGTFLAAPMTSVQPVMGQGVYDIWNWLHIGGTSIGMAGLGLENYSHYVPEKFRSETYVFSLCMQLCGHICMGMVLTAYEYSAISDVAWDRGTYSIFVIAPYVLGCFLLALQVSRKLWRAKIVRLPLEDSEV